jgi:hypothetical protein
MRKPEGGGNARVCLKVEDISQAVEYLRTKRIHANEIETVENGKLTSSDDPDGNEVYLWQYD